MTDLKELTNAIILQAVADYARAYMGYQDTRLTPSEMMQDCECFFKSELYDLMTKVNSDVLIKGVKERELDDILDFISNFKMLKRQIRLSYKEPGKNGKTKSLIVPPMFAENSTKFIDEIEVKIMKEKDSVKCQKG